MSQTFQSSADISPVSLRYAAALRGILTPQAGSPYTYALVGSFEPEVLFCLASSNPEGSFIAAIASNELRETVAIQAKKFGIANIRTVSTVDELPGGLNFLCYLASEEKLQDSFAEAFFDKAQNLLAPGGLFVLRYKAYDNEDEILRFIATEYAVDFPDTKDMTLLQNIRSVGTSYFAKNPARAQALETAMSQGSAAGYIEALEHEGSAISGTFTVLAGLLPRGFAFVGDANIGHNYMELTVPEAAHNPIIECENPLLYQPLKDFAMQRTVRNDIWVKTPVEQSFEKPALFGPYVFGITQDRAAIPSQIQTASGKDIDLSSPLFQNLIAIMDLLPMGIGDFLAHPQGQGFEPDDVLAALQILVAFGIAQPMRTRYESLATIDLSRPVVAKNIAPYLNNATVDAPTFQLASTITGRAVTLQAKDALVLQAIGRVGLPNSSGAVYHELQRMNQTNPTLCASVTGTVQPTPEVAHQMVQEAVEGSLLKWFAYGLLAA